MKHETLSVALIYGSVRSARQGIKAARYLEGKLKRREVKVHFIDPLNYSLPLLDKMYKEFETGKAPENMELIAQMLSASDGFLVVTGEYNHSVPPALKNLLDHFQAEFLFKPSAIASYSAGHFGGVRAAVHLRTILGELGAPAISSMLPFPGIENLFNAQFETANKFIEPATQRFLDEFIWYLNAFKDKREEGIPF